ncbi:MAG TPA: arylsulfatase [Sedimentisphaerales bacterium]|nr:arylsulfatase [Sedimentisphaerales bacterium]
MNRRTFLQSCAAGLLLPCFRPAGASSSRLPNVVLILSDDQGFGDIHSHGNDKIHTPVLDRLAAQGARFDRFFVSPVCAPTRASLLTGRYFLRTGVVEVVPDHLATMQLDEVTLAEAFKQAGYATGLFGKWHLGKWYPYHPNVQGFDEFVGFRSGAWGDYFDPTLERNGKDIPTKGYITDVLTGRALEFIEAHRAKPFFCYIPYNVCHSPFQVPDRYFDKYKAQGLDDRTAAVYGMCENMDENVGRILARLEALKLVEDTIVVFLTDNGPNGARYNAGMRGNKGKVDEGGVRVPMFVRWPGHIAPGTVVREIAADIDVFPTLVELCGIRRPKTEPLDGRSVAPLLLGHEVEWLERTLFSVRMDAQPGGQGRIAGIAARTPRWRLTVYGDKTQLYDMIADPGQKHDVAPQHPQVAAKLRAAVERWYADVTGNAPPRVPIPVGHEAEPVVRLGASDGQLRGTISVKGKVAWDINWIHTWTSTDDCVSWDLDVVRQGMHKVSVIYANPHRDIPVQARIEAAGASIDTVLPARLLSGSSSAPNRDRVPSTTTIVLNQTTQAVGKLLLGTGRARLHFRIRSTPGAEFRLNGLILERIE